MKKMLIALSIFGLAVLGTGFACAVNDSTIDINMSGSKEISPNNFQIKFEISTTDKNAEFAITKNKEKSDALYKALKSMIKTNRGDYVKTENYSLNPVYKYNKNERTLTGYKVNNSVVVFAKDVNLVSKLIDVASSKGVTEIGRLNFNASEYEEDCNQLLADLTKKVQKRADAVLKPLNMQILTVKSMSTSCSASSYYPSVNYARTLKASAGNSEDSIETPIEVGKTTLKANVNTTFYIGKLK